LLFQNEAGASRATMADTGPDVSDLPAMVQQLQMKMDKIGKEIHQLKGKYLAESGKRKR
jgi:outer membrane murein-binding lipoprotein Lpp